MTECRVIDIIGRSDRRLRLRESEHVIVREAASGAQFDYRAQNPPFGGLESF
jgi:hypothetical protein